MKKVVSLILAFVFIFSTILAVPTYAAYETQEPTNGGWVRIRYAGSGRYLDVPAEGINNNGTQLQLWEEAYGNQNQIFYTEDTGNGWKIYSHMSGKVIEVRNSSHDDFAEVAQWDDHDGDCARWDIISHRDGTVSFRNRESGKYLNVHGGGNAGNGTKIIQYYDDGTIAMRFYLEVMTYSDVLSATFERDIQRDEIEWSSYNPWQGRIINQTGWQYNKNSKYYLPTSGQSSIFASAEYLSPNTVATMLRDKSYNKSTWDEIQSALSGELTEDAVSALITKLGFKVPGLGYALGILQVLMDSKDAAKWNRFVDAAKIDKSGRCSGVIVYTYYDIVEHPVYGPMNNGTTAYGFKYYFKKIPRVEYKSWNGDNFYDVSNLPTNVDAGTWSYHFK